MEHHRLSAEAFTQLAVGICDKLTVDELKSTVLSRNWWLLVTLVRIALERSPDEASASGVQANLEFIDGLRATHPVVDIAILTYPQVGAYFNSTLREQSRTSELSGDALINRLAHLGNIALAAALHTGVEFLGVCQLRRKLLRLPGLGGVSLAVEDRLGTLFVRLRGRTLSSPTWAGDIELPNDLTQSTAEWQPIWRIETQANGLTLKVVIDDIDGHAVDLRVGSPELLTPCSFQRWTEVLVEGWEVLTRHHPEYAASVAAGLRVLAPMSQRGPGQNSSASAEDAFGSIMLSRPEDPLSAAETLIHEWLHNLMGAVKQSYDLVGKGPALLYVGWRDDPRPPEAAMQGVYAFLGVSNFWRVQCRVAASEELARSQFQFARWLQPLSSAIKAIQDSGAATRHGEYFLECMVQHLATLEQPSIPPHISEAARLVQYEHRLSWELRNCIPNSRDLAQLAAVWLAGNGANSVSVGLKPQARSGRRESQARSELIHLKMEHPGFYRMLVGDILRLAQQVPGVTPADVAYAEGDLALATQLYLEEIRAASLRIQAWVGWACARQQQGSPVNVRHLLLAYRLSAELLGGGAQPLPDPQQLVDWLST